MKRILMLLLVLSIGVMPSIARTETKNQVGSVMPLDNHGDDDEDDNDEPKPYTHHEVTVGYGLLPSTSFRNTFWTGNPNYVRSHDYVGSFFVTYTYRFNQVVGLGATFAFDPANRSYSDKRYPDLGEICKVKQNNFTTMVHLKINWLNTRVVAMYSKVGLGVTFGKMNTQNFYPDLYEIAPSDLITNPRTAYSFVPVGIELGNRQYAAFMQVGFGAEGVFSLGFRYGFGFNKTDRK